MSAWADESYAVQTLDAAVDLVHKLLCDAATREATELDLSNKTARFGPVEWSFVEAMERSARACAPAFAERVAFWVTRPTLHPLLRTVIASCVARPCTAEYLGDGECRTITAALLEVVRARTTDGPLMVEMLKNITALAKLGAWHAPMQREVLATLRTTCRNESQLLRRWSYDLVELMTAINGGVGSEARELLRTADHDPASEIARRYVNR